MNLKSMDSASEVASKVTAADSMPLHVAADLWAARFGNGWVMQQEVRADPFFRALGNRLQYAGMLTVTLLAGEPAGKEHIVWKLNEGAS